MKSENPITTLVHFIHHYFIWIVVGSYAIAALLPGFGLWIRAVNIGSIHILQNNMVISLPLLMLATLLFNAGLGMKQAEFRYLLSKPWVLLAGVAGNLLVPLSFIIAISLMMKLWHNPEEVQQILVGLALVASMPIAGASTAWAQNANGNLALSLGLVLLTTLFSPLLTPLALHTVGLLTTGDYSEDLHELASGNVISFLGAWVILPSLLGIVAHRVFGESRVSQAQPYIKLLNYGVLILLNYSNAALTLPQTIAEPDVDFLAIILAIVVSLCIAAFYSGFILARLFKAGHTEAISLMFGLGMSNNGTGLVLASVALADHPQIMLPIIFYNLVQHLVASTVDFFMSKQAI